MADLNLCIVPGTDVSLPVEFEGVDISDWILELRISQKSAGAEVIVERNEPENHESSTKTVFHLKSSDTSKLSRELAWIQILYCDEGKEYPVDLNGICGAATFEVGIRLGDDPVCP